MRCVYSNVARENDGDTINDATVTVYLAGTSTLANIYTTFSGATPTNSVTTNSSGEFTFYVDRFDYDSDQKFKYTVVKTGQRTKTYDNIDIDRIVISTYAGDKTLTTNLTIPKGVIYSGTITVTTGTVTAGLYQVFSGTVTGLKESRPEWWGTGATAIQSALDSLSSGGICNLGIGTYTFANITINNANTVLQGSGWGTVLTSTNSPIVGTPSIIWVKANNVTLKDFKVTWATLPTALLIDGDAVTENHVIAVGWERILAGQTYIENTVIDNVYTLGAKTHAISLGRSGKTTIKNCRIENYYGTGIIGYYSSHLKVLHNEIMDGNDDGIYVHAAGPVSLPTVGDGPDNYCYNVHIEGNTIKNAGAKGIGVGGVQGFTITGNTIDRTYAHAIEAQYLTLGYENAREGVISNNVIRYPFQNFGAGATHATSWLDTVAGSVGIIEVRSYGTLVVSNNVIYDDYLTYTTPPTTGSWYGLNLTAEHLTVNGNSIMTDAPTATYIGDSTVGAPVVKKLSFSGNTISISANNGWTGLYMFGVEKGTIAGNTFDCGGEAVPDPGFGKFLVTSSCVDVLVTGNSVFNVTGDEWSDTSSTGVRLNNNLGLTEPTSTTAGFQDDTHVINTVGKYLGKIALCSSTGVMLYAAGPLATDHWYTLAGVDTYTPTH
jgi:hypothetical protein